MAAVSASTTLLLTDLTLRPPESTWDTAAPDGILIVEATRTVNVIATAMTTGTGIGRETVTVIALRVATTGIVVTGTRRGTGVIEGAPVATPPIAGREEATLAAQLGVAPAVLANMTVTVINPGILVVFCHRLPSPGCKSLSFSSYQVSRPLYRTVSRLQTSSCSVN